VAAGRTIEVLVRGTVGTMSTLQRRIARLVVIGATALGFLITPTTLMLESAERSQARPCYNGIVPGNPYVQSCQFPQRTRKPPGGTPDQAAVIACRGWPGCLSWYINNPH
jgi:hypothetical protein